MEIWSTETRSVIQSLPGHAGEITALAFSLDGKLLASATEFGEIKVWEIQPQQP
jgi:WD40 repeat protein